MARQSEKSAIIAELREQLKPGSIIYTDLKHVSSSGMTRSITVKVVEDGVIRDISYKAAIAIDRTIDKKYSGLKIGGCGMDAGFSIVYDLGAVLYPDGFECIGQERCKSNDHFNGDRNYEPHHHKAGGYAFDHRWL